MTCMNTQMDTHAHAYRQTYHKQKMKKNYCYLELLRCWVGQFFHIHLPSGVYFRLGEGLVGFLEQIPSSAHEPRGEKGVGFA